MAKKSVKYYVVDAFTESPFRGNPAAVCLLEDERGDEWLRAVAAEFNISLTCFLTRREDQTSDIPRFNLRWFTTVNEVPLCGHGTLAAAHTLFTKGLVNSDLIEFDTLSGILTAKKVVQNNCNLTTNVSNGEVQDKFLIELNFPVGQTVEYNSTEVSAISHALGGASIVEIKKSVTHDILLVLLPSGKCVEELQPKINAILNFPDGNGIIVTGIAPSDSKFDFYSRVFAPKFGINEDSVTGTAHCALAPFWSEKLGKCDFVAYQASPRTGILDIHLDKKNQRVLIRGKAVTVMEGSLLA
jgi:PhzF family phenazine biosynthesis protein